MGCFFCCMDEASQVKAILENMEVVKSSEIKAGDSKFVVGRVVLASNPVIAPVSNQPCVYYRIDCEEHVKKKRTDADGNEQTYYEWEHMFTETKQCNFLLCDPAGPPVFVPAEQYSMKVYVKQDVGGQEGGKFFSCDPSEDNPNLRQLLERHGANGSKFFGANIGKPRIRYREGTFSVNELIAVLGTAAEGQMNGIQCIILNPCSTSALNEEYFEAHNWSGKDIKCWNALTESNSLIATDDSKYMKGIVVDVLPMQYNAGPLGTIVTQQPVVRGTYSAGQVVPMQQQMMPQQGYPQQQMMPQQGYPQQQMMPQQGYPQQQMMPQQGYPQQQQMMPQQGYPQQQQMMPQQGYPQQQQMMPQQGYPQQQMMPQQGYPQQQQMMPQQGYPQQQPMMPQQGYPQQQMMPQQGDPQQNQALQQPQEQSEQPNNE